jgi:hypothetical protein
MNTLCSLILTSQEQLITRMSHSMLRMFYFFFQILEFWSTHFDIFHFFIFSSVDVQRGFNFRHFDVAHSTLIHSFGLILARIPVNGSCHACAIEVESPFY